MKNYVILLILLSIAWKHMIVEGGSIPLSSPYTSNFLAGTHLFIQSAQQGDFVSQFGTVTYGATTINNFTPLIGFVNQNLESTKQMLRFYLELSSFTRTQLIFKIQFDSDSHTLFKISWLKVDDNLNNNLCISNYSKSGLPLLSASKLTHTQTIDNSLFACSLTFNTSHTIKAVPFVLSADMKSTNREYQTYISIQTVNSTSTSYTISIENTRTDLYSCAFNYIMFDETYVIQQTEYYLQTIILSGASNANISSPITLNPFYPNNTFIGMTGFHTQPNKRFEFNTTISNKTTVAFFQEYVGAKFTQIVFPNKNCSNSSYQYLNSNDLRCYDDCGDYYFNNASTFSCSMCYYTCLDCTNSTSCTSCSSSNFRQLNGSTCQPMVGYFESNATNATSCQSPCLACQSLTICSTCVSGYYINGSNCIACSSNLPNCLACNNSATCTLCDATTSLNATNKCVASSNNCSIRQYPNNTNNSQCLACHYSCYTCSNSSLCLSCNSTTDFRQLNGTNQCVPLSGYFESNAKIAAKCSTDCDTCSAYNVCLTCPPGLNLTSYSTCVSDCGQFCRQCSGVLGVCLVCKLGMQLKDGLCKSVCGDGIVISPFEACDDGNILAMDGCSPTCTIEPGFSCSQTAPSFTSQCRYTLPIGISYLSTQKSKSENTILVKLKLSPMLREFETMNFSNFINVNLPNSNYLVSYNPQTGELSIKVAYNETIQNKQAVFTFVSPGTGLFSTVPNSFISTSMIANNNQALYYYSDSVYNLAALVGLLSIVVGSAGLFVFVLSLFGSKLIGVEAIGVLQLSYYSLLALQKMNPVVSALLDLNIFRSFHSTINTVVPNQIQGLYLSAHSFQNLNIQTLFVVCPLFIGVIGLILTKKLFKNNNFLKVICERAVGEYTFCMLMFILYIQSISSSIELLYGIKQLNEFKHYVGIIEMVFIFSILIIYFILLIKKPQNFGEFTKEFKPNFAPSKNFYNYLIIQRFVTGFCLVFIISFSKLIVVPMIFCALQLIYVLIKRPYIKKKHNIRVVTNLLVCLLVLSIYFLLKIRSLEEENESRLNIYLPLCIPIALLVCILYNGIFILVNLKKIICQKLNKQRQFEEQEKIVYNEFTERMNQKQAIELAIVSFKNTILKPIDFSLIRGQLQQEQSSKTSPTNLLKKITLLEPDEPRPIKNKTKMKPFEIHQNINLAQINQLYQQI